MNYDSRGGVSAAFSYPRAKASTSFPAVLNLLKRSELIDLIVENIFPLILQEAVSPSFAHDISRTRHKSVGFVFLLLFFLLCFTSGNKVSSLFICLWRLSISSFTYKCAKCPACGKLTSYQFASTLLLLLVHLRIEFSLYFDC